MFIARAPGRLDVMGGIADYSGALVLELPLACATWALVQRQAVRRCDVATRRDGRWHTFSMDLDALLGVLAQPEALHDWILGRDLDRWPAYPLGVLQYCLQRAGPAAAQQGFKVLLDSTVPEGKGIASSAAVEVACLTALAASCGYATEAAALAAACQWVENHVVGAPCGIMDQMTSACGQHGRLLRLRCQPGTIEGHAAVPDGLRLFGVDSGVRHAVTGADYGTVRTAAFMGYRMIAEAAGLAATPDGSGVRVADPQWGGYLANISPTVFGARYATRLPERMAGSDFLSHYGGITDTVTSVRPDREYPVRAATAHPVHEQARVERFAALLGESDVRTAAAELGELMYASHASYGACGLGSGATDRLVAMVREAGPARGLFGAKITGGGSGGTVAMLGTADAEPVVRELAARYAAEAGCGGAVFAESGPGAAEAGVRVVQPAELAAL